MPNLEIEVITVGILEVNSLLVYDSGRKSGIIIDPGDEAERILAVADRMGVSIEKIVLTHGHGDHIGAVDILREELDVPVLIGREDAGMLTSAEQNLSFNLGIRLELKPADELLDEGDTISVGSYNLNVLHTPGHSRGSITLVCDGHAIVGDLVFMGSIGRTDLPGGSMKVLMDSIRSKILPMPDDTIIYPGHGPTTTVGRERTTNPFITGEW